MTTVQALIVFFAAFFSLHCVAALPWTATPFNPPSIPLAVRTPYLSAWLHQKKDGVALNGGWPGFWAGRILGWAGFIRVDGKAYSYLGDPGLDANSPFEKAKQTSFEFTSTQSTFILAAGPIDLTVKFFSPVEPNDLVKQSLPFSYMAISAKSTDGGSHTIQIYSDTSAEWVSGDSALRVNWTTSTTEGLLAHQVQLEQPKDYAEINDQIQHGTFYYSTLEATGVTYQTGADKALRAQFIKDGKLNNSQDTKFRAIQDNFPVFAFAHDLGSVSSETSPLVVALGHVRSPVIQYVTANNVLEDRVPYFTKQFTNTLDALKSFIEDYSGALARAGTLDGKVKGDATKISSDYAEIVALSVRQFFGSIEFTLPPNADGSDDKDLLVFMKEISSNGNMNTVDVIFPAWPAILYFNPAIGKHLLEVLFRYQATGLYPNKYALHDIGAHYPQALGHNDGQDEPMPVEESGNMIIMTLSYIQKTGDTSQAKQYIQLLDQWTKFLVNDSLIPEHQISTDDFAGPLVNQTNLAVKGIIGIKAMSEVYKVLGDTTKSSQLDETAKSYIAQWEKLGMDSDGRHLTLNYGNSSTWGLSYNMYADKLLGLNLVPQSVYETQTAWYKTVSGTFGVPLDTRHTYTKSDWEIWTAAIMTDTAMRDTFIKAVKSYASSGIGSQPFGDWYETLDGEPQGFRARPVAGGHLALLTLDPTNSPSNGSSATTTNSSSEVTKGNNGAFSLKSTYTGLAALLALSFLL